MEWQLNNNSKYKIILDEMKKEKRADIHSFHRYFGKLIPAIPKAFISEFTKEGDVVADLFSGSGTVAIEAKILNRNFVGCEINPLSHFISVVKTNSYDVNILNEINQNITEKLYDEEYCKKLSCNKIPFCINIEHWFKPEVINDLIIIEAIVDDIIDNNNNKYKQEYKEFYYAVISSIIRNVSNADPQHVFPGISKRIRKMEVEGKIHKDAKKTFINALKKRTKYFNIYSNTQKAITNIMNEDSVVFNTNQYKEKIDLFVTNPPYISSVRYIETVKLEMYWLEYVKSQLEYGRLSKKMIGNDRVDKKEISENILTSYAEIDEKIKQLREKDLKSAFIVTKYFNDMENVIVNMNKMLKLNGRVVVKISDSNVKKIKIETGKFLTLIAKKHGFDLVDVFLDKINDNSRSLTTARNTYSDIIIDDYIIIWEKIANDN